MSDVVVVTVEGSGDTVLVEVTEAGAQGLPGPAGASAVLTVTDSVANAAALPAAADHDNEFWLAEDTGVIWFSNGIDWVETTINAGSGATDLSITEVGVSTLTVASSTGTDVTIPAATASAAGLATAAQITKLNGIEAGATAAGATGDAYATSHEADTSAHLAVNIVNTPAGSIAATTVQAALNELDNEKAAAGHTHAGVYEPVDATLLRQVDVDDTPVNGVTTAPVSSNWAYDHATGTGAHAAGSITASASATNYTPATADVAAHLAAIDIALGTSGPSGGLSDGDTLTTGLTFPATGLHILDTNASHDLILSPGSDLTADRTLTLATGDASRTLTLTGDASVGGTNTGDQDLSGYVTKASYDANSILAATADNTPAAVTVAEQTLIGRVTGGSIDDLSATQVRTLLNVAEGASAAGATGDAFAASHPGGNQHIDWTADQGATNIHIGNIPVGTTSGTVAAGDDSRITGAVQSGGALGTPSSGTLTNCSGLPASGIGSGDIALARLANVDDFVWAMALSGVGLDVTTGYKGGAAAGIAGDIISVIADCSPNNEPAAVNIEVDLYAVNRSTGTRQSVLSTACTIPTGANQGAGTVNATYKSVTADTWLEARVTQGSDGRDLTIRAIIQRT